MSLHVFILQVQLKICTFSRRNIQNFFYFQIKQTLYFEIPYMMVVQGIYQFSKDYFRYSGIMTKNQGQANTPTIQSC